MSQLMVRTDSTVEDLVIQKQPYLELLADGRIKCTLNGHIMPATVDAVQSFASGSKFKRLEKRAQEEASFQKYEPFILQSKNRTEKLYCALTCMLINKNLDSLRKHMKGKAFLRAKDQFESDKLELMEEPDFEEPEASQSGEEDKLDPELLENIEDMDLAIEPSLEQGESSQQRAKLHVKSTEEQKKSHIASGSPAECKSPEKASKKLAQNRDRKGRRQKGHEANGSNAEKALLSQSQKAKQQQQSENITSKQQSQVLQPTGTMKDVPAITKNSKRNRSSQPLVTAKRQKQDALRKKA